jgi:two-component system NtrC family sensor kinase
MSRPLQSKIFIRFLWAIGLLAVPTLISAGYWFHQAVIREAQQRVNLDLRAAQRLLNNRMRADQAVLTAFGRLQPGAVNPDDPDAFREIAAGNGLDFGGIFNPGTGRGTRLLSGERLSGSWPGRAAGCADVAANGFILLPLAELAAENPGLAEQVRKGFGAFRGRGRAFAPDRVLATLSVAASTPGPAGSAVLVYGGRILAFNDVTVDSLRDAIFQRAIHGGKPLGTVTLFQQDLRVATNVLDRAGERAVGTAVSGVVFDEVLRQGRNWTDRAYVVDTWYLAAYEPLRSPAGGVLGMLYVGVLEKPYLDARNRIVLSFLAIFLLGALATGGIAYLLSRALVRPLDRLLTGTRQVHEGGRDVRMTPPPGAFTEIIQLMDAFNQMVQAIRERDVSLTEANSQLGMINRRLEVLNHNYMEMLGFVTHEISNMLGVMVLDAHSLRDSFGDGVTAEQREILGSLIDYLEKFREMIRNYLNLSRIEKDKLVVQPAPLNLQDDVFTLVQRELAGTLQRADMRLECAAELGSVELDADASLLRIVFYNLIHNAVKYGFPGGLIRVGAEREAPGGWAVRVWNEGIGIPEEARGRLFEKFHRVRAEGRSQREGTGLGLFISRTIVERHGGRMSVRSEPGAWAEFTVHLPA